MGLLPIKFLILVPASLKKSITEKKNARVAFCYTVPKHLILCLREVDIEPAEMALCTHFQ